MIRCTPRSATWALWRSRTAPLLYIAYGPLGGGWRMGILAAESLPAEDVLYYIRGMITTFCQHGNCQNRAKARTHFMQGTALPGNGSCAASFFGERCRCQGGRKPETAPDPRRHYKTGTRHTG